MKRTVLFLMLFSAIPLCFAQLPVRYESGSGLSMKKMTYARPDKDPAPAPVGINPAASAPVREWDEQQIGVTWYDLQTNHMLGNRMHFYPEEGTLAATWTYGINASSFGDRGTGYNYYNGSAWGPMPTARIEDERTGWPTYAPLGENGEMTVAHLNVGLKMSKRDTRGSGAWTYQIISGPPDAQELAWPTIMTNGENNENLHLLVNSYTPYQGQELALMYYRSFDGGATWDTEAEIIEGLGIDYYTMIYSDSYAWANPVGDTIAFIAASAWNDLVVMKSTDNGENWDRIVVWEHPYPMFDWDVTITDTFYCVDNSAAITLDQNGKVHVAFGIGRALHDVPGDSYWIIEGVDGIGYWNEDMEPFGNDIYTLAPPQENKPNSEMVTDVNYIGWTQDVDGDGVVTLMDDIFSYSTFGVSTQPAIACDEFGNVFIAWASATETYTNGEYNLMHIWLRAYSPFYGWLAFNDVTDDLIHYFDECILPRMAFGSDNNVHLMYFTDITPGIAVNSNHSYQEYKVMHTMVPRDLLIPTGIMEPGDKRDVLPVTVHPNPIRDLGVFSVTLYTESLVNVEILAASGLLVDSFTKTLPAGSHQLTFTAQDWSPGLYFYRITSGAQQSSGKLVVQ